MTRFLNVVPSHILMKIRTSNFVYTWVLMYSWYIPRKGMCLGSRDQEINDNISETVQDRDIVAMED